MRKANLAALLIILWSIILSAVGCLAEDGKVSPHSDMGDCGVCHVAPADKLRGWFVFTSTKKEMKHDMNKLCLQCHAVELAHVGGSLGVGKGHATGKKPSINRQDLPLASDGTVTCAITCHNMHVSSEDRQLQSKRLRMSINSLCMSCHNM